MRGESERDRAQTHRLRGLVRWASVSLKSFVKGSAFSWLLLASTFIPGVSGIHLLITQGRPETQRRDDVPLIGIEKTTRLVTSGVFKYIRHPLYCSLFLLAWGVFFKDPSLAGGGLTLAATALLLTTARVEEVENIRYFGTAYRAYMQQTKMFIPFLL